MSHLSRIGNPSVFSSLPFDQIDGFAGFFMHDDFLLAETLADTTQTGAAFTSEYQWWASEINTNDATANVLVLTSVADHPGIIQLQTGATTPGDGDGISFQFGGNTIANQEMFILDDSGLYLAAVLRILDVSDQNVEFGLIGENPQSIEPNDATNQADLVALAFDPADADNVDDELWFGQSNVAGTDTEAVGALGYVESDWVLLEIGVTDTSAHFRITTEDGTETLSNNLTQSVVALRPNISTANIGSNEELLDIDLFHLRHLRRDSLVGQANDWLGA